MSAVGEINSHVFAFRGFVTLILKDPEGNIKRMETIPNIITQAGIDNLAQLWGSGTLLSAGRYMGLAGTTDQGGALTGPSNDNTVSGEGAYWNTGRMTGSYVHTSGQQNWTISTSWSGGDSTASAYIYYVGIAACQSIGGIPVLAKASFAVVSKASQDTLTVAWTFCISNST